MIRSRVFTTVATIVASSVIGGVVYHEMMPIAPPEIPVVSSPEPKVEVDPVPPKMAPLKVNEQVSPAPPPPPPDPIQSARREIEKAKAIDGQGGSALSVSANPSNGDDPAVFPSAIAKLIYYEIPVVPEPEKHSGRRVTYDIIVSSSGQVSSVNIILSSGEVALDRALEIAVKRWVFEAGSDTKIEGLEYVFP